MQAGGARCQCTAVAERTDKSFQIKSSLRKNCFRIALARQGQGWGLVMFLLSSFSKRAHAGVGGWVSLNRSEPKGHLTVLPVEKRINLFDNTNLMFFS